MITKYKLIRVYLISLLFIFFNIYLILIKGTFLGLALPFLLFVFLLYFISLEKVLLLTAFFAPLSLSLGEESLGAAISIPTEPLLLGIMVVFLLSVLYNRKYDFRILKHPVSIIIILQLLWILITSITSELPVVSIKYFIARLWFVVPAYFFGVIVFKDIKKIYQFIWLYVIAFMAVIFYTLSVHAQYGFGQQAGHWVMQPFFKDHTSYGAMLAFFIPVLTFFSFSKQFDAKARFLSLIVLLLFVVALVFSYSRAAWLGLIVGTGVYVLVKLRIKFSWIMITTAIVLGLFFTLQNEIIDKLEKNKQESSSDFMEHVYSMTNISTDASNLERLNRWSAAVRLYRDRPLFGWGPGTYQFVYAPYQLSYQKTVISTNAGDLGNAHSEYLGPLAEQGLIGIILMFLLVIMVIYRALIIYAHNRNNIYGNLSLALSISLITYYTHGIMNNFLDMDKAALPFWAFTAMIVALDILQNEKTSKNNLPD